MANRKGPEGIYNLPLTEWSHTDYSYLQNNTKGWVSNDEAWWCFNDKASYDKMEAYLESR